MGTGTHWQTRGQAIAEERAKLHVILKFFSSLILDYTVADINSLWN